MAHLINRSIKLRHTQKSTLLPLQQRDSRLSPKCFQSLYSKNYFYYSCYWPFHKCVP